MKHRLLLIAMGLFCLASCNEKISLEQSSTVLSADLATKSTSLPIQNFIVTKSDVAHYVRLTYPDKIIKDIVPIMEGTDTALFVVQFENGWSVISRDKRTYPVLACDSIGTFDFDFYGDLYKSITKTSLEESGLSIQNANNSIDEGCNVYSQLWDFIKAPSTKVEAQEPVATKSTEKYWIKYYLGTGKVEEEEKIDIDHLIRTKWGQWYPWNKKMPMNDDTGTLKRCPTGCTAVASAQLIYYWHYESGVPSGLWHDLSHSGTVDKNNHLVDFERADYVENSPRWDLMPLSDDNGYAEYVSDLMLDIGERLGMTYKYTGSGAWPSKKVFNAYGLTCTEGATGDFPQSTISSEIKKHQPVLIVAWTEENVGHTFLIDGIWEGYELWATTYQWGQSYEKEGWPHISYTEQDIIEMELDEEDEPHVGQQISEYFTIPKTQYRVNWGWSGDGWGALYSSSIFDGWSIGDDTYAMNPKIYYEIHN